MTSQKETDQIRGTEKEFTDRFRQLTYSRSGWEVWSDLMTVMACSIHNSVYKEVPDYEKIETEYEQAINRLGGDDETLGLINSHKEISATRFMNYIEKQAKIYKLRPEQMNSWNTDLHRSELRVKNLVRDWKDYISWCASLKVDLKDEYYLLPPNFQKAHDEMYIKERIRADAVALEKQKKMMKKVNEIIKNAISEGGYSFKTKKLMIVVPKDAADIKREGELQHHCVGGYVDKVARGETMILFVRQVTNPDKPYYTMEWKNNKIEQCRGERNKDMTPDVKAFVKAFEQMKQREKLKELEGAVG